MRTVFRPRTTSRPQGPAGIKALGHRAYVGGLWEEIGALQFDFLISQGLLPRHRLVDVGCGSLRAGVHFINYLDSGNYCGMDKERDLVRAGVALELGPDLFNNKRPRFVISDRFAFDCCDVPHDYALAQSLFTHLTPESIGLCLSNLRSRVSPHGVLFATFNESADMQTNPERSHDHDLFYYTRRQMEEFGSGAGWIPTYLGEWGHPRKQMMIAYRPERAT